MKMVDAHEKLNEKQKPNWEDIIMMLPFYVLVFALITYFVINTNA
ncbi:MAG: hypothetical protein ACXWRE_10160 [Pseudobdellovibrionaceae bacterium]